MSEAKTEFNPADSAENIALQLLTLAERTDDELCEIAFALFYELALRAKQPPRSLIDNFFTRMSDDDDWRIVVEPALRKGLGR